MHILLITDDSVLAKIIEAKINTSNVEVSVCGNFFEAEDFFSSHKTELVITDYILPDNSGLEIARYIREDLNLNIPIIMLSEVNHEMIAEQAKQIGINEYITKPFSPHHLAVLIKKLTKENSISDN